VGDPVMERPTMLCLGMHWIIDGDDNANATISVEYKHPKEKGWQKGANLFRVEKGKHHPKEQKSLLKMPDSATLYAGSIVLLQPDTEYDVRLKLEDPDGRNVEKILKGKTRAEPVIPTEGPIVHVYPDNSKAANDGVVGLNAGLQKAEPGTRLMLHAGTYAGGITIKKSGEAGKPIVLMAAGDGEVIIDGGAEKPAGRIIEAVNIHDVWFEGLTIRNGHHAIVAHESERLVVRRCHFYKVDFGVTATRNSSDNVNDYFIADNVIEGPSVWPRSKGIEDARGIQLGGSGHVVCYNRVRGFGDAIDTYQGPRVENIDFHNNDVSELTDDGIEMDYSQRNTRCFYNRLTNVYQGITTQPVYGGPVYVFRNVMYNVVVEPYKMHNSPSGAIFYHNTIVKTGMATGVLTPAKMSNCVMRNDIVIGTQSRSGIDLDVPMENCDFDYVGIGGGPWSTSLVRWHKQHFKTVEELKNAPGFKNSIVLDVAKTFKGGVVQPESAKNQAKPVDLQLAPTSEAVDAGQVIPGFNDGFLGKAPDLGAYEVGAPIPHYGPRPKK
jgi:hypothetical protein